MTLPFPFPANSTDAKKPITNQMMDQNVRQNIESLSSQIDAISVGGGGGVDDNGAIGEVLTGGLTNIGEYYKKRYHPTENMLIQGSNFGGFDPEGVNNSNDLVVFLQSNDSGVSVTTQADNYLGQGVVVAKDSAVSFVIKKGVNFFSIGYSTNSTGLSDNIEVYLDGSLISNVTDENGDAASSSISSVTSDFFKQVTSFFYGLDGEEHIVTLKNNDSGSDNFQMEFVEAGYRTENPALNENLHITEGIANIRGSIVNFDESVLTIGKLNKNGHEAAVVCDNISGALSIVNGESVAMTQVKAEESISFSSTVTTLPVKNNWYFPDNGICVLSTQWGSHHLFSYDSKSDSTIQSHSFDDIIWQSQPTEDFTPLDGFTGSVGETMGDLNINYWGTAPIVIGSSNNKLDFKVTIAGVETTHVATIPSGSYSADLVPIGEAISGAMKAAKDINGGYVCTYSASDHLWMLSVDSQEVSEIEFLFGDGVNFPNSIHPTLGFDNTNLSGKTSYIASNEVQHLSAKVFEVDPEYISSDSPKIKRSAVNSNSSYTGKDDIQERLGSGSIYTNDNSTLIQIYPKDDTCGLRVDFIQNNEGIMMTYQVDDGQFLYLTQTDSAIVSPVRGKVISGFISFPKGSRKISIRSEVASNFEIVDTTNRMMLLGVQRYFAKPAWEKLTKTQSIIKTLCIAPSSLYATIYGNNGGSLYSPSGTDQISTVTESGSWSATATNNVFNAGQRWTNVNGDYVDYTFVLVGDGGGFFVKGSPTTSYSRKIAMFLSSGAIVEGTDRIQNTYFRWGTQYFDQNHTYLIGLPAGTYTARIKVEDTGNLFYISGFGVIDTISPEENKNTVSDITGAGQSVSYPVNVRRIPCQKDSGNLVPIYLERTGFQEGSVSLMNLRANGFVTTNYDDQSSVITVADQWYSDSILSDVVNEELSVSGFFKSVCDMTKCFSTNGNDSQAFVDGIQFSNSHSDRVQVKGGAAPSATRASVSRLSCKEFKLSCSFSSGDTFTVTDTRGISVDRNVLLYDGTNYENVKVTAVVAGVSFDVSARSVVVDANVERVDFQGFHTFKIVNNTSLDHDISAFEYEPLTISPSKYMDNISSEFITEKISRRFKGLTDGSSVSFPTHTDGIQGNWMTSIYETIRQSGTVTAYDLSDIKNISITGGGSLDIKITSIRKVKVNNQ